MENKKQHENAKVMINELDDQQLDTVNGGGRLTNHIKEAVQQALQGAGLAVDIEETGKVRELLGLKQ